VKPVKQLFDDECSSAAVDHRSVADLVGCVSAYPTAGGAALSRAARGAEWLLVRADCVGDLTATWLRQIHPCRLIYALRTRSYGGRADPHAPERKTQLGQAALTHDLVELEAPHDLVPEVLAVVPRARRLVTWRGPAEKSDALLARLEWLTGFDAANYQLVVAGCSVADGIGPMLAIVSAARRDVVAYATGESGMWSRVLSAFLGSPFVHGSLDGGEAAAGEPSVARLVDDFGLPDPGPVRMTFGIAGEPVSHSLSPRLHNGCYRMAGIPAIFLPFPVAEFGRFWDELIAGGVLERLGLPLGGLTVSSPNKEMVASVVSAVTPAARRAQSANLVYRRGGHWIADTTDPTSVIETMRSRGLAVAKRRAAVVGCGGSGRAIASALARAGAEVVLCNRSRSRGEMASRQLGLPLVDLSAFSAEDFNLIVNATPVGRSSAELPFACNRLVPGTVIIDLVYAPRPTSLAVAAAARGADVVSGHEVLLVQATRQFEKMTGRVIPFELMAGQIEHLDGITPATEFTAPDRSAAMNLVTASSGPMAVESHNPR
jgi:3-dehydroquinate dehydratase / shikimate dehydrogenase